MNNLYQLKDIGFNYPSGFGLDGINLEIEKSAITAFVGPNGSGKTSLLNIFSLLNIPDRGSLNYDAIELSSDRLRQFRRKVGYVQQNPYLLRGTVFSNIELGLRLKHVDKHTRVSKVNKIMDVLNIAMFKERIAQTLSGGEAQKVAIAQMLVLDPEVLILDEPFTHLDKQAIQDLEQLIMKLKNELDKTIIFTTHDKFQAQWLADQVYSVINGKVFKSQLANLFNGKLEPDKCHFNIGKKIITIPVVDEQVDHISIDPKQIVLSKTQLDSSMKNSFPGKITRLVEENGQVRVGVDAGENFEVIVSHQSLSDMNLSIGADVWISFKSSSILLF
ncbi:MAG: ATP-binding cassette domain-containing protein [Proteobacteria bacterium]|nr:ATP-binding cassette domain-containing protein [Pseudomonadota bacterium]